MAISASIAPTIPLAAKNWPEPSFFDAFGNKISRVHRTFMVLPLPFRVASTPCSHFLARQGAWACWSFRFFVVGLAGGQSKPAAPAPTSTRRMRAVWIDCCSYRHTHIPTPPAHPVLPHSIAGETPPSFSVCAGRGCPGQATPTRDITKLGLLLPDRSTNPSHTHTHLHPPHDRQTHPYMASPTPQPNRSPSAGPDGSGGGGSSVGGGSENGMFIDDDNSLMGGLGDLDSFDDLLPSHQVRVGGWVG